MGWSDGARSLPAVASAGTECITPGSSLGMRRLGGLVFFLHKKLTAPAKGLQVQFSEGLLLQCQPFCQLGEFLPIALFVADDGLEDVAQQVLLAHQGATY